MPLNYTISKSRFILEITSSISNCLKLLSVIDKIVIGLFVIKFKAYSEKKDGIYYS